MKIYFCDVCNESIPLQDIKDGVANTIDGRIYCREHNPLRAFQDMSGKRSGDRLPVLMYGIVIVLLVVVLGIMIFGGGDKSQEYATLADQNQVRNKAAAMQTALEQLQETAGDLELKTQELDSENSVIQTDMVQLRGDLGGIRGEIKQLSDNLKTASDARKKLDGLELKLQEFNSRLSSLEGDTVSIRQQISGLREKMSKRGGSGAVAAVDTSDSSGVPENEPGGSESEELIRLRKMLSSNDNSVRFEAVNQVYDRRIREALPYLLPLLEDRDQFVQVGAIQTVGEFNYLPAIPILVKVLRDTDVTVREESLLQLIRMTGETGLEFDSRASASEREKAVKKWEDWLKKNQ
jgi:hypothetical protein